MKGSAIITSCSLPLPTHSKLPHTQVTQKQIEQNAQCKAKLSPFLLTLYAPQAQTQPCKGQSCPVSSCNQSITAGSSLHEAFSQTPGHKIPGTSSMRGGSSHLAAPNTPSAASKGTQACTASNEGAHQPTAQGTAHLPIQ